ncbi:hypothetical protein [Streptomyces eurythermus]|uniref:hypothetical protein n=1 Tax=Streptomyces eurythermus TaxID=42237 RepID=UPI0033F841AD
MRDPRGDLLAAAVEMQPQPVAVPSPRSAVLDAEHASVIGTVEAALDSAPDDTGRLVVAGDAYTTWTLEHPDAPHEANRRLPLLTGILRRKRWSSSSPSTGRIRQRKRRYWPRCEGVAVAMVGRWLSVDPRNLQRRHLRWHAVLQSLAAGDLDDARRRADTELHDSDVGMRAATDWRLLLIGKAPARLTDLAHIHCLLAEPGGWAQVFHTFQLALALSVAGDSDGLTALAARAARDSRPPTPRSSPPSPTPWPASPQAIPAKRSISSSAWATGRNTSVVYASNAKSFRTPSPAPSSTPDTLTVPHTSPSPRHQPTPSHLRRTAAHPAARRPALEMPGPA